MRNLAFIGSMFKQATGRNPAEVRKEVFQLGQIVTVDISPFILLIGSQARYQDVLSFNGNGHIMSVTELFNNRQKFFRVQFTSDQYILACVDEREGKITECYWFKKMDTVTLTTGNYNTFLGDDNGLIGWWQFQVGEEEPYNRYWQPWDPSVPVRVQPERFSTCSLNTPVLTSNPVGAMMYWKPTNRTNDIAPLQEYLWVEHFDARNDQHVDIYCGYDIDPALVQIL